MDNLTAAEIVGIMKLLKKADEEGYERYGFNPKVVLGKVKEYPKDRLVLMCYLRETPICKLTQ